MTLLRAPNRAASLRKSIELQGVWREKLPVEYWSTLAALRSEEAKLVRAGQTRSSASDRFELKLSEMEAQARNNAWKVVQDRMQENMVSLQKLLQPK